MKQNIVRLSKFLSLVLRHKPETIGLFLDPQGWARVDELLTKARAAGVPLTEELLREVVEQNGKQRFALSDDGTRSRANQGYSVNIDLGLEPLTPQVLVSRHSHSLPGLDQAPGSYRGQPPVCTSLAG